MAAKQFKPNFSQSQASEMVTRIFSLTPSDVRSLPSYIDQNFFVETVEDGEYVLKITNSEDSKNIALIDMQTYAMAFLHQKGLPTQTARPTTDQKLMSLEENDCGYGCQKYMVRLLNYLPGTTISKAPLTPQLLYETGRTAATMDTFLQEMKHPQLSVLERGTFIWNMSNVCQLEEYLFVLNGDPLQEVVKSVIHQYKLTVEPKRSSFHKCIIHGDFNDYNVLVEPNNNNGFKISGILDFGHIYSGYYIYELALAVTYMMIEHPEPIEVGGPVLAGWETIIPLNQAEKDCLYVLVLSRLCQSLVMGRNNAKLQPENADYILITSKKAVQLLNHLWKLGKEHVEKVWFEKAAQFTEEYKKK